MSATVDGIVSGFDTTGLIDAVIGAARVPVLQMEDQIAALNDKREKIAGLSNRLEEFATTIEGLQDDALRAYTATSSHENYEVTASPEAAEGSYRVRVTQLARGEVSRSNQTFDSQGLDTLGHGNLRINYAGTWHDITIDDTNDGIAALADTISEEIEGLQAYVIDTGSTSNPFRLMVKGEMGADNTISFDSSGLSNSPQRITFGQRLSALDMVAQVDQETVRNNENVIDNIPGLEINVTDRLTSWQTINVTQDVDATVEKVQSFVDKFNEVRDYYLTNTVYNEELDLKGPLVGESGARRVMGTLGDLVTAEYANDGALTALSQLGIKTERNGKLDLDVDQLKDQLATRQLDVEKLFLDENGPLATIRERIEDTFVDSENGTLKSREDSIEGSIRRLEESIDRKEDYLSSYTERLRERFVQMETVLAQISSTGSFLAAMMVPSAPTG